jgi:metal-sulfur cluster biosynthetic enzyme
VTGLASDAGPLRATADASRTVLEGIVDPCSRAVGAPAGLVSMGLVLDVSVSGTPGAATVHVKLGITEPGCMMQGIFAAAAERAIRALPGVIEVVVSIDHGHVWDPDAMTAEYRAQLSRVRAERNVGERRLP